MILNAIEAFLVNSNARSIRVNELYFSCPPLIEDIYWRYLYSSPVSYSDCYDALMAHPWFEVDPKNRNIFKVVL